MWVGMDRHVGPRAGLMLTQGTSPVFQERLVPSIVAVVPDTGREARMKTSVVQKTLRQDIPQPYLRNDGITARRVRVLLIIRKPRGSTKSINQTHESAIRMGI